MNLGTDLLSSPFYHKINNSKTSLKSRSRTDLGKGDLISDFNRYHSFDDPMDVETVNFEVDLENPDPFEFREQNLTSFSAEQFLINEPTTLASTSTSSIPVANSDFGSNRESLVATPRGSMFDVQNMDTDTQNLFEQNEQHIQQYLNATAYSTVSQNITENIAQNTDFQNPALNPTGWFVENFDFSRKCPKMTKFRQRIQVQQGFERDFMPFWPFS